MPLRSFAVLLTLIAACGGGGSAARIDGGAGGTASGNAGSGAAGTGGQAGVAAGAAGTDGGAARGGTTGSAGTDGGAGSTATGMAGAGAGNPIPFMGANWPMPNPVASGAPNPHSYDLATAGVVRDNVTALDWEQGHSEALSWRAATTYCADLDLGGHSDWRVPTRIELVSLLDFSRTNPPLDATAFPSTVGPTFWTSSVLAELPNSTNPMSVWVMDIVAAGTTGTRMSAPYPSGTSLTARVRCVRGEPPAPAVRFKVETDTVYDNGTRLTWHRGISSTGVTWEAAKQACVDLTTAGGGWRLPTVKELLTIVDERTLIPAIDATAFPGTPGVATSARAWTSSALAGNQYSAWIVTFERGHAETNSRELSGFVRCVR